MPGGGTRGGGHGGGTIGLFGFQFDEGNGGCQPFTEYAETDGTFPPARLGVLMAFALGFLLVCLNMIHYSLYSIPYKSIWFSLLGALQQVSLGLLQIIWSNDLCDTFGCTMGLGYSWIGLAHVLYVAAFVMNLFITTELPEHATKNTKRRRTGVAKQEPLVITSPLTR